MVPFAERVATDAFRREAVEWIAEQARADGRRITGPIDQPRIRPWSTQLTVPTDAGRLWFKTGCAAQSFEPALQDLLGRLVPDSFDRPLAIDADRGWMLTVDRGEVWGEQATPTLDDWVAVAREAAAVQRTVASAGDELRAIGLPDCSPETVPERLDGLVDLLSGLPADHPGRLPAAFRAQLVAARPRVVDAAARLAESRLPSTWQHGDLHPWNVFSVDGALRLFDLGDAQWAHPLELLVVPRGFLEESSDLSWEAIAEAWADVWGVPWSVLADDWSAAQVTHGVNRAETWCACLSEATTAEWQEWGDAPTHHLGRVLDA